MLTKHMCTCSLDLIKNNLEGRENLNYATIKYCDISNGPGVRTSLYVSGCTHHCKHCFNPMTWDFGYGKLFDETIEEQIMESLKPEYISGFSLLGGEPMEIVNQRVLFPFVKKVKERFPNKTIWCYSGYLFDEQLLKPSRARCQHTDELLSYIDVLVDGKFEIDLKDITLRFKGSRNQRVIDVQQSLKQNKIVLSPYNEKRK